jgi:hypothetical protein
MWVNEPGSYNSAVRIDNSCRKAINIADRRNLSTADCDVATSAGTARAVDQRPVFD